jgi:hypothetical protein
LATSSNKTIWWSTTELLRGLALPTPIVNPQDYMAFHLPTDLPTYLPTSLVEPKSVQLSSTRLSMNLFNPPTFFHLLTWLSLNSFNQLSSAHFNWSLNFIQPIFFHLLRQLNLNSISQLFHLLAYSVESEIIQPTFLSTWLIWLSLKFIQPNFFICLLIWSSLKFIQPTFSSAHWVESEFIQLTFSSAQLVESESGFELPGWVQI